MQIGWIDFSKEQRNKVLSVISLLSEPTAVDELGIGNIRDGFADIFFPGTSTIQTRAKYFLVVPYILMELEQRKNLTTDTMLDQLYKTELDLIETLKRNSPAGNQGIIGEEAGRKLKRKPSEIYWNGFRTFGIFKGDRMSLTEYCRLVCVLKAQRASTSAVGNARSTGDENDADDNTAAMTGLGGGFWCSPQPPDSWLEDVAIELTGGEANFLKRRIIAAVPESMMAFVLKAGRCDFIEYEDFGGLSALLPVLPVQLAADYCMARGFMDFISGAYIRFNMILSGGTDEYCQTEWDRWKGDIARLAGYDLEAMFARLRGRGVHINDLLRKFLLELRAAMRAGDEHQIDALITAREVQIKGKTRSKLYNAAGVDYKGWVGIHKLVYRLPSAQRIVADIMAKAGDGNA